MNEVKEDIVEYLLREPERTRWAEYARQNHANPPKDEWRATAVIQTLAERLIWIEDRLPPAVDP